MKESQKLVISIKKMIEDCRGQIDSVREISKKCIVTGHNSNRTQLDISKLLQHYLMSDHYQLSRKMEIFHIVNAIMAENKNSGYVRHLAPRIRFFLKKYSIHIKDNDLYSQQIHEIFTQWRQKKIFCGSFISSLAQVAKPIFTENQVLLKQRNPFKIYNKSFLMKLRDTNKVKQTQEAYQSFIAANDLRKEHQRAQVQIKKLILQEKTSQNAEKAKNLLIYSQELINRWIKIMQQQAQNMQKIESELKLETKKLGLFGDQTTGELNQIQKIVQIND